MDIRVDKKELEKQLFEEKENEEGSLVIKICVPEIKEENFSKNGLSKIDTYCIVKGNNVNPMTEAVGLSALDAIMQELKKDPLSRLTYELFKKFGKLQEFRYDEKGDKDNE